MPHLTVTIRVGYAKSMESWWEVSKPKYHIRPSKGHGFKETIPEQFRFQDKCTSAIVRCEIRGCQEQMGAVLVKMKTRMFSPLSRTYDLLCEQNFQ